MRYILLLTLDLSFRTKDLMRDSTRNIVKLTAQGLIVLPNTELLKHKSGVNPITDILHDLYSI